MPKSKCDELIDALTDPRVIDALTKALGSVLSRAVEETIDRKLAPLQASVADLTEKNKLLKAENLVIFERLSALETYTRRDNLIFRGIPERSAAERATAAGSSDGTGVEEESSQAVEETIVALCNDRMGISLHARDIAIAHRLKAGPKDRHRPVIVRFASRRARDLVYSSKKTLHVPASDRSTPRIFVSEHLTKEASALFFEARKAVKDKRIYAAWSHNGQVFVRHTSDQSARPCLLKDTAGLI